MARVVMQAVVSVDGYIAYRDDTVGPLFDWYGSGDSEVPARASGWTFHVSLASADYVRPFWDAIKVTVIGRHLFDTTNGWDGDPAAGDELVVVTHRPLPEAWLAGRPDAPFHTAGSVEAGIALAKKLAGDGLVCVTTGDLGGQAFSAGLVDEIAMDVPRWFWVKGCASSAATPEPSSSTIPTRWSGATACCTCTTQSSADAGRAGHWWRGARRVSPRHRGGHPEVPAV